MKQWFVLLAASILVAGCGSPGAPQPPSLNLPEKVQDLSAVRQGNIVTLSWTMPRKTTDRLLLKGPLAVHLCRRPLNGPCDSAADLFFDPGVPATFKETLPPGLTTGNARLLTYFVEVRNRNGRSVGFSNEAYTAAGKAPAAVAGFRAEPQANGVHFYWQPIAEDPSLKLRLHRSLVTSGQTPAGRQHVAGMDASAKEPDHVELIAAGSARGESVDVSAQPNRTYNYSAERLDRLTLDGNPVDLAGPTTERVLVDTKDVFPPAVPMGLVVIPNREQHSFDLSWTANTEPDLAGYFVYRRQPGGEWQRVSGEKPLPGPAWRDTAPATEGSLVYAVTAIDFSGNESKRSSEVLVEAPQP